jgi:hypothetical protein
MWVSYEQNNEEKCYSMIASYSPFFWRQFPRSISPLKRSGYYMYHPREHSKTLHSAHTVYLCVPYGSHNKQRLFPQTALTGWAL